MKYKIFFLIIFGSSQIFCMTSEEFLFQKDQQMIRIRIADEKARRCVCCLASTYVAIADCFVLYGSNCFWRGYDEVSQVCPRTLIVSTIALAAPAVVAIKKHINIRALEKKLQ